MIANPGKTISNGIGKYFDLLPYNPAILCAAYETESLFSLVSWSCEDSLMHEQNMTLKEIDLGHLRSSGHEWSHVSSDGNILAENFINQ